MKSQSFLLYKKLILKKFPVVFFASFFGKKLHLADRREFRKAIKGTKIFTSKETALDYAKIAVLVKLV